MEMFTDLLRKIYDALRLRLKLFTAYDLVDYWLGNGIGGPPSTDTSHEDIMLS